MDWPVIKLRHGLYLKMITMNLVESFSCHIFLKRLCHILFKIISVTFL